MSNFMRAIKDFFIRQPVYIFPILLTLALIILVSLKISGTSIGIYHTLFYGDTPDHSLLYGSPQSIRSDEWIVTSQKAISQSQNKFRDINTHLGNGENTTLLADMPYADWSTIFKPHNLGFLFLPLDNAFALKWWIMPYLLILSVYSLVALLLPSRLKLAVLISLAFACSPFLNWWFINSTFASLYLIIFSIAAYIKLFHTQHLYRSVAWGVAIFYLCVCFALILYPPFQIPVALVALATIVGYSLDHRGSFNRALLKQKIVIVVCAVLLAGSTVALFLYQQRDTVATIRQTAYPGQRVVHSGGYNLEHLLSSNLSYIFQSPDRAAAYTRPEIGATNQSESSNFILISPLLIIPLLFILYRRYRKKGNLSYISICLIAIGLLFTAWAFIPHVDILGKITLLSLVPLNRLLIGFGLLNILFIVVFIKEYSKIPSKLSTSSSLLYALCVLVAYLLIDFHIMREFPAFIGFKSAAFFAIPFAVTTFLLLRKYYTTALVIFFLLSLFSIYKVNPIYQGTEVLTQTPISKEIQSLAAGDSDTWVSDYFPIENFPSMNGANSLTGTYTYPQLQLWDTLGLTDQRDIYNRYAHVSFTFDRDANHIINPSFRHATADQFNVLIEPCNKFFMQHNVSFLITTKQFTTDQAPCGNPIKEVVYPKITFYIYQLTY